MLAFLAPDPAALLGRDLGDPGTELLVYDDARQEALLAADRGQDECTDLVRQLLAVAAERRDETVGRELQGAAGAKAVL